MVIYACMKRTERTVGKRMNKRVKALVSSLLATVVLMSSLFPLAVGATDVVDNTTGLAQETQTEDKTTENQLGQTEETKKETQGQENKEEEPEEPLSGEEEKEKEAQEEKQPDKKEKEEEGEIKFPKKEEGPLKKTQSQLRAPRSAVDSVIVSTQAELVSELSDLNTIPGSVKTIDIVSDINLTNVVNVDMAQGKDVILHSSNNATLTAALGKRHFEVKNGANHLIFRDLKLVGGINSTHINGEKLNESINTSESSGGIGGELHSSLIIENVEFKYIKEKPFVVTSNGTVLIKDCSFIANSAHAEGSAVKAYGSGTFTVENSLFQNNYAKGAPGQANYIGATVFVGNSQANLVVKNCAFIGNKSHEAGTNSAAVGGGGIATKHCSGYLYVTDCYFYQNEVESPIGKNSANGDTTDGGAIYAFWTTGEIKIENSTFEENVAGDEGGAISVVCSGNTGNLISNNTFVGNRSRGQQVGISNGYGKDGIDGGGAIEINGGDNNSRAYSDVISNTFYKNNAEPGLLFIGSAQNRGGGISFRYADGNLKNNIISGNIAANATYNDLSIESTAKIVNENNLVGQDVAKIYGTATPVLSVNENGNKAAGYDIKTLKIAPNNNSTADGLANGAGVKATEKDQRGFLRATPADIGAVDIVYVEYNANGGKWTGATPDTVFYDGDWYYRGDLTGDSTEKINVANYNDTKNLIAVNPTKGSEIFLGWNTKADGTGTDYPAGSTVKNMKTNVVLYAQWSGSVQYTITYHGNKNTDGAVPVDSNSPYGYNGSVTVLGKNTLEKANHTFTGWNTQADGQGEDYQVGQVFTITGNMNLYAQWAPVPTYTITYHGNESTKGVAPTDTNSPYNKDSSVTVLGKNTLEKANHTFAGWNTQANGQGEDYQVGQVFTITGDMNLYAQWTPNATYTVIYKGNTNTGGAQPVDMLNPYFSGSPVTVKDKNTLVKENYTFTGWNTQADGKGTTYSEGAQFVIRSNVVLYAQWSKDPNFNVTYKGNGNTGGTVPVDGKNPYVPRSVVTVLSEGNLTREGYNFTGWNTKADGKGNTYQAGGKFLIVGNVTLYAQWEKKDSPNPDPTPDPQPKPDSGNTTPPTGDNSHLFGLFLLSTISLGIVLFKRKKQTR